MDEECERVNARLHQVTRQLYSSKAACTKQHGKQPLALAVKAARWRQHGSVTWDITLSRPIQHCEEHNRQGWPFKHRLPLWLCVTMQSNRTNIMISTKVWQETGGSGFTALSTFSCVLCLLFYEYQFNVYLRNIIISKSDKQSFRVGTAHYFPDRCMRDGCRVELQHEMCHLSVLMTERSI